MISQPLRLAAEDLDRLNGRDFMSSKNLALKVLGRLVDPRPAPHIMTASLKILRSQSEDVLSRVYTSRYLVDWDR